MLVKHTQDNGARIFVTAKPQLERLHQQVERIWSASPPGLQPGLVTEDDRRIHKEVAISPFEAASRIVPLPRVLELLPSVAPVNTLRKADELCRDVRGACRGEVPTQVSHGSIPTPIPELLAFNPEGI